MRDPATGDWIPEDHFGETDIAELRPTAGFFFSHLGATGIVLARRPIGASFFRLRSGGGGSACIDGCWSGARRVRQRFGGCEGCRARAPVPSFAD